MKTKQEIRTSILSLRNQLSQQEWKEKSEKIREKFFTVQKFQQAKIIHTYISSKKNEVDTKEIIHQSLLKKKRIAVPKSDRKKQELLHSEIFSLDELSVGEYGILESRNIRFVNLQEIDLVIIPAVAVTRSGVRLGFGKGYYDKFLQHLKCTRIVLCFDFQIVNEIPQESHDQNVDMIITEKEIMYCRK